MGQDGRFQCGAVGAHGLAGGALSCSGPPWHCAGEVVPSIFLLPEAHEHLWWCRVPYSAWQSGKWFMLVMSHVW